MSKSAKDWLKRQKIDDKSLNTILVGLVASSVGGVCQITQMRLAKKVGMSERHVRRGLSALEALEVIDRSKQSEWGKRGRSTDTIYLSLDLDFNLPKDVILSAKNNAALTGHLSGAAHGVLSGQMSGAPTISYIRKNIYGDDGALHHRCIGRIWWDSNRELWRSMLTVDGEELDLGRHETKDLAEAEINVAICDLEFCFSRPAGTPVDPQVDPFLKSLTGKCLCEFVLGRSKHAVNQNDPRSGSSGSGGLSPSQEFEDEILILRSNKNLGAA
ncbi:hypothetical protein KHQ08_12615 [Pseudochrobactrum algeriensis]|uniref:hypothetical protein n=1 Tax=Pseudochrobactrum TaxID=354349 RepID=UPI001BCA7F0E|nr:MULTISPECIES: hypothetical protein [Pseudochrobactrum]MDP8250083.1 hypothetical protein [Pseudochrobactrum saccharolyticum]QVQ36020.1 hypothetical protein KHQ08_12615 [Pseudochrobactrum algeriensis]QVQ39239.1 hypothetical protein KHQ07_10905 [Pseudochrobactrum algeriensis]QVQ43158.1 hypothetical protein KHQ09_12865 [Pseudochrobactrum algeriensis]UCA44874.1 hypothetical protein LDL70_10910 [Pseudochrobactrum sp. XF203]